MKDFFEALAGALLISGLVALYCWATPDQMSAEYDAAAQESEEAE